MAELSGHCTCGLDRMTSLRPVLRAEHCHCDSCRRVTASPFTRFFAVPRAFVTWHGDLATRKASGERGARRFCPTCGTQMSYQNAILPDETHLYAASLDDPSPDQAEPHEPWGERLLWGAWEDDLPKHSGCADAEEPVT